MNEKSLEEILEMHVLFWQMSNSNPLIRLSRYEPLRRDTAIPLANGCLATDGMLLEPQLIDPKLFIKHSNLDIDSPVLSGVFLRTLAPSDLCWTQSFIGCPIRVSAGKVWAEPFIRDVENIHMYMKINDKWLRKFLEFTSALIEFSGGRLPVVQPLFRGPMDMAASALGPEKLCVSIFRYPNSLRSFLDFCAEVFIQSFKMQLSMLPKFSGGYSCMYGIWAPEPICRNQADYSVLISPRVYEKMFLPYDLKIIRASKYSIFHLHSANIHLADKLIEVPKLSAVQVSIDYPARAFSPPIRDLIPTFKKMQGEKPLIITGPVTRQDLRTIRRELSPKGLALDLQLLD